MFQPTHVDGIPAVCFCCSRHATGCGVGNAAKDPKFLCKECVGIIEQIRHAKRLDAYELDALDGGVEAVGDFIDTLDGKTELANYDELERRMLVKAAWQGCADRLREIVRAKECPF